MGKSCHTVHQWFNRMKKLRFLYDETEIPENGIYILFEKEEPGHFTNRIVRIGTHTGQDRLRLRLFEHFLREKKDRSIFRKNIGRALLNKDNDPFLEKWNLDLTSRKAREQHSGSVDFDKQEEVEKRVTEYIQDNFSFVVFQVDDKAGRLNFESKIISTVSLCKECKQSGDWLGNYSPKAKIRKSGLWQEKELWATPLNGEEIRDLNQLLNLRKG